MESRCDDAIDQWLAGGAGGGQPCDKRIETPISSVFLFADRALKRKKAVDFGFLDFTTLDQRHWAGERELSLNRLTAPDVYRQLHAIVSAAGALALASPDAPDALDYVLEMRRFDETAVLSECPDRVNPDFAESLGREIARFHGRAAVGAAGGGAAGQDYVIRSNVGHWRQLAEPERSVLSPETVEAAQSATLAAFESLKPLLDARQAAGFVRACHGDLHLGNILLENGRAVLFDRIEFNDRLIEIDVLYDLAFLLMDLSFRGRAAAANRALNGWLDEAARSFDPVLLHQGLAALDLFQSVRAGVRCHVVGHNGDPQSSRAYLAAAQAHLQPSEPRLLALGGLSGTGKSTLARAWAPTFGNPPGAVILRSDEVRKRLFGRAPTEPLPSQAYGPQADAAIYQTLFETATNVLAAGRSVVLDATFRDPARRAEALRLHSSARGVWLTAPDEVLRARVASRTGDASDADLAVLERQLVSAAPVTDWTPLDAGAPLSDQVGALQTQIYGNFQA